MVEQQQELQKGSFIQVEQGTPSSQSSLINYDTITVNQYDPLNESASLNNSISTSIHPENNILEGDNSIEFDFNSSIHEIDDHYQHQDKLQQPMSEEPSLDAKTDEEYKDQYATQGQEDEEEMSKLLWHQCTQHTSVDPDVMDAMLDHAEGGINLCSNT